MARFDVRIPVRTFLLSVNVAPSGEQVGMNYRRSTFDVLVSLAL
jgi:hypothetical protein